MTLTLLVDLDDTLLNTNIVSFEQAYLKALASHLSGFIRPDRMVKELLAATRQMILNDRPDLTMEEVFDAAFYPALGVSKTKLEEIISVFYEKEFPKLKSVTAPKADADRFVHWTFSKGHRLIVATNPLFPRTAIYQRLSWAGFPPDKYPFSLISSYENSHFAKPNPAYYAELLAKLGWPDAPVIMVGNDLKDDIQPSAKLGLNTFWVNGGDATVESVGIQSTRSGNLDDLVAWLENPKNILAKAVLSNPETLLHFLKANLAALYSATSSPPETNAHATDKKQLGLAACIDEWRNKEQDIILPAIQQAVHRNHSFETDPLLSYNPLPPLVNRLDGKVALEELTQARLHTIHLLSRLPLQVWRQPLDDSDVSGASLFEFVGQVVSDEIQAIRSWYQ
jgi:FMN phosphatase YigB (HAD superfamily)